MVQPQGTGPAGQGPAPRPAYGAEPPDLIEQDKEARNWGMLCHLSSLVGFIGVPSFIGPLVVWLMKKDTMPFVDDQGKEALNFQITIMLAAVVSAALICFIVGIFLLIAVGIFDLVMTIMAAMKASNGVYYRYPFTLRLVK